MLAVAFQDGFPVGFPVPGWQKWTLAGAWVLGFVLPAVWVARDARGRGIPWFRWFVLVLLASFLGVMQYRMHVRILSRRARKEEDLRELTDSTDLQ